jgi:hypothetical protein
MNNKTNEEVQKDNFDLDLEAAKTSGADFSNPAVHVGLLFSLMVNKQGLSPSVAVGILKNATEFALSIPKE